jgi:hypothetical protein
MLGPFTSEQRALLDRVTWWSCEKLAPLPVQAGTLVTMPQLPSTHRAWSH